jgi:hypothetical protein
MAILPPRSSEICLGRWSAAADPAFPASEMPAQLADHLGCPLHDLVEPLFDPGRGPDLGDDVGVEIGQDAVDIGRPEIDADDEAVDAGEAEQGRLAARRRGTPAVSARYLRAWTAPPHRACWRLALPCGGVQAGGAAPRQRWKGQKQNYPGQPCGEHPGRSLPRSGKQVRVPRPLSAGVAHRCERSGRRSPPAILRASAAASELGRRVGGPGLA